GPVWHRTPGNWSTLNRFERTAKTSVANPPTAPANAEPAAASANNQPQRGGWFWCTVTLILQILALQLQSAGLRCGLDPGLFQCCVNYLRIAADRLNLVDDERFNLARGNRWSGA